MTPTNATELVTASAQLLRQQGEARTAQIEHAKRLIAKGRSTDGEPYIIETEQPNAQPS